MNILDILLLLIIITIIVYCRKNQNDFISVEKYPKNKIVKFNNRWDRYGSVVMPIVRILLSNYHNNNTSLFHIKDGKDPSGKTINYSNSVMYENFLKFPNTKLYNNNDKYDIDIGIGNLFTQDNEAVGLYKKDLISIVRDEGFKERWYDTYYNRALKEGWTLPNNKPYISIHYRSDDLSKKDNIVNGKVYQQSLSAEYLNKLINILKTKYPQDPIFIITTEQDITSVKQLLDINNIADVIGSNPNDYDKDLWIMMNSKVLVITSSLYPLIAGMLNKGKVMLTNPHDYYTSLGLFTHLDKSGWIKIEL